MKQHISNKVKKEYNKAIPDEIRVLFGRFTLFSIIFIIFFSLYPFVIANNISIYTRYGLIIVLPILYILMVIDVLRKKKSFSSTTLLFFIILSITVYIFSIYKLFT